MLYFFQRFSERLYGRKYPVVSSVSCLNLNRQLTDRHSDVKTSFILNGPFEPKVFGHLISFVGVCGAQLLCLSNKVFIRLWFQKSKLIR